MLGAIAGDVIGSIYEGWNKQIKTVDFPLFSPDCHFTDDTVLTIAVADAILQERDYATFIQDYARRYPNAGYGGFFKRWIYDENKEAYNSFGNGSAMRVSPVGWAFDTREDILREAERSASVTHNHPEGIKGAQAVALAVFLARQGQDKTTIQQEIIQRFNYDLKRTLDEIRPSYSFDVSCQGSVPESIIAFLESESVEDAIRKAISLGGDSDTMACISGAIAEAYYRDIPEEILITIERLLPRELLQVVNRFAARYY
jgi:ADP-ribosylglycohydrolase